LAVPFIAKHAHADMIAVRRSVIRMVLLWKEKQWFRLCLVAEGPRVVPFLYAVTVMLTVTAFPPVVAVILAVPTDSAVTRPLLTVAIA